MFSEITLHRVHWFGPASIDEDRGWHVSLALYRFVVILEILWI